MESSFEYLEYQCLSKMNFWIIDTWNFIQKSNIVHPRIAFSVCQRIILPWQVLLLFLDFQILLSIEIVTRLRPLFKYGTKTTL